MDENNNKLSFKDYYQVLKKKPVELRDKICLTLGISEETFYKKMKNDAFAYPQMVVISQILGQSIEELFPEKYHPAC